MQKSVTTVCLHCSFARLKNKHIGVLGTNVHVATISWLHWSPVSGYSCTSDSVEVTRGKTPGSICRYKEDGLVSRPPAFFTSVGWPMHGTIMPKVSTQVLSCLVWLRLNTPSGVKREGFVCAHEVLIYSKCSFSCAFNALGSSMLTIDDGRAFHSVTVLGRKEYL